MGKTYQIECLHCQYRAKVSGGADAGLNCEVQTIVCRDCRELMDVYVRIRRRAGDALPPKFPGFFRPEIPPAILRDGKVGKLIWKKCVPACPVDAKHRIEEWRDPGRCPRCGIFMEKNGFPFRVWE